MEKDKKVGRQLIDLKGMKFGSYEIIKRVTKPNYKGTLWLCRCTICGREAVKASFNIRNGEVKNCECQLKAYVPSVNLGRITHEFGKKYGCNFCADNEKCLKNFRAGAPLICKYAEDIDKCGSFDKYLEANTGDIDLREYRA